MGKPALINTLTTEYISVEDRIRLSCLDTRGEQFVLWLTRRMAEKILLPSLIKWAESYTQAAFLNRADQIAKTKQFDEMPMETTSPAKIEALAINSMQIYEQLEARIATRGVSPVRVAKANTSALVVSLGQGQSTEGIYVLEFRTSEGGKHRLALEDKRLRQWLEALYLSFERGNWRMDRWPVWMRRGRDQVK